MGISNPLLTFLSYLNQKYKFVKFSNKYPSPSYLVSQKTPISEGIEWMFWYFTSVTTADLVHLDMREMFPISQERKWITWIKTIPMHYEFS